MERILLYIVSGETRTSWNRAIELSKSLSATLFALFIVDKETVRKVANLRGKDEIDTAIEIEEEGWKYLYHLEEKAVDSGVKTALFLEEGNTIEVIRTFVKDKEIDLLIVGHRRGEGIGGRKYVRLIEQLIEYIPCPVLIEKEGG
ncbi:MAG: universal stress protein [Candidatus Stahlbacteria bacterium]|jgi:nucleotide-binding universal stress UspA family protein|nr:universal stress protein [candidate division WOR-3 bacterium]TEU00141.1 MAG: universal stress protein [Candidatus Stahlbacteria bacterium]